MFALFRNQCAVDFHANGGDKKTPIFYSEAIPTRTYSPIL